MRIISSSAALLLIGACGAGANSTAVGPLGAPIDLRKDLPATVRGKAPPTDASTGSVPHEFSSDVGGATVRITWHSFTDGGNQYLLSYAWEVTKPKDGVILTPLGKLSPINVGSAIGDAGGAVESETVQIGYSEPGATGSTAGTRSFHIDASGAAGPS